MKRASISVIDMGLNFQEEPAESGQFVKNS